MCVFFEGLAFGLFIVCVPDGTEQFGIDKLRPDIGRDLELLEEIIMVFRKWIDEEADKFLVGPIGQTFKILLFVTGEPVLFKD